MLPNNTSFISRDDRARVHSLGDKPAVITVGGTKMWFHEGMRHRLLGPAIVTSSGQVSYFLDDTGLSQQEWARDIRVMAISEDPQDLLKHL